MGFETKIRENENFIDFQHQNYFQLQRHFSSFSVAA